MLDGCRVGKHGRNHDKLTRWTLGSHRCDHRLDLPRKHIYRHPERPVVHPKTDNDQIGIFVQHLAYVFDAPSSGLSAHSKIAIGNRRTKTLPQLPHEKLRPIGHERRHMLKTTTVGSHRDAVAPKHYL